MNIFKKILPVFVFLVIAALIIRFRSIPQGKTWNGYKVLYVAKTVPQENVENILMQSGVNEFADLNNQNAPVMLVKNSIEETMFRISLSDRENAYLYQRQNYFYDLNQKYLLYYIPQSYEKSLNTVLSSLKKAGYEAGLDSSLSYLWLLPLIMSLLAIILFIFSKNKVFFGFCAIMPCIFVFCNAFYASTIAAIILLLIIFIISNIYSRKGAVKKLLNNYGLIAAFVISIVAAFSADILTGIFYLLTLAALVCAGISSIQIIARSNKKASFSPVLIRSAKMISIYGGKTKTVLPLILAASVLVIAYFALASFNVINSKADKSLYLPGSASKQDEKLPDLEDFYRWNWNLLTSPYKSLNQSYNQEPDSISYPRYKVKDGTIVPYIQTITYDKEFKKNLYDSIDNLDFFSIESVIKNQGEDFFAGYSNSASYNVSFFSIIMMIICFLILLFIYFSAMIRGRGRK